MRERIPQVIDCFEKEVYVRTMTTRKFIYDRVFGPDKSQQSVYDLVARPILDEVLQGYNCTILAYGQTGTGKTYTMTGDMSAPLHSLMGLSPTAGIIPRILHSIFKEIEGQEAVVKLSFIEIYNEQLRDLFASGDEDPKLKLFDDGRKQTTVKNLEEISVSSMKEAIDCLIRGSMRREVAATKCNDLSRFDSLLTISRSHAIFTIVVHLRQSAIDDGDDLLTVGKLNLVDLAGSENIGRSGAVNSRAREAGEINKSLLTLGRVINALVDNSPHVPYR